MFRRLISLLLLFGVPVAACGGRSIAEDPLPASAADSGMVEDASADAVVIDSSTEFDSSPSEFIDGGCTNPAPVLAASGGNVGPPLEHTSITFDIVYQGNAMGIEAFQDVDSVVAASDPTQPHGTQTGFWAEVQPTGEPDAGVAEFTRLLQDPTRVEAPGDPDGGGFVNGTLPICTAKRFRVQIPGTVKQRYLVIYGPPYGTEEPSVELARFGLIPVLD